MTKKRLKEVLKTDVTECTDIISLSIDLSDVYIDAEINLITEEIQIVYGEKGDIVEQPQEWILDMIESKLKSALNEHNYYGQLSFTNDDYLYFNLLGR